MKINYISDTHIEFEIPDRGIGPLPLANINGADVLVLAGDIDVKDNVSWVRDVSKNYNDVIYIMGNHEYYRGKIPNTLLRVKDSLDDLTNVHVLENSSVKIQGKTFHGATMWTDGGKSVSITHRIDSELNDFRLIRTDNGASRFTANYSTILHEETIKYLKENVKEGDVVVTHHAPSFKSASPRYKNDQELNCAYMSNLEWLIKEAKPSLWFHGHVHTCFDYMVGDTNVLCNPRGYVGYEENLEFKRYQSVEI